MYNYSNQISMKKLVGLIFFVTVFVFNLSAQRVVSGTITDANGEALIGANVLAKGTAVGTITDFDGGFSLEVPADVNELVVTYAGFETQEIALGDHSFYGVTLAEGVLVDEIVVTGQGVGIERKRLTSTVDVITSEDIEVAPVVSLDQLLQSRLNGAQVTLSSGQPGTASLIRNRGPISAQSSTTPVILIDGVRLDNLNSRPDLNIGTGGANSSALSDIPVESIERIEFIRGGAASTLYGTDAANGVIQIFTKRGTAGQARVNAEVAIGTIQGETEFLRFRRVEDLVFERGLSQSYRIGVDGGNDRTTYNFSANLYDDDGFNAVNENRRIGLRTTIQSDVGDNLIYTGSAAFTSNYFTRDFNANTSFARFGNIEGGSFGDVDTLNETAFQELRDNLQVQADNTDLTEAVQRYTLSNSLGWTPFEGFTTKLTVGLDNRQSRQRSINSNALLISKGSNPPGTVDQGTINIATRNFTGITTDLGMQYRYDFGDLSFISGAGGQLFRQRDEQYLLSATNVTEGSNTINNSAETTAADAIREIVFGGFYFSQNIGYKNKLFVDGKIRFDGNSAFGESIGLVDIYSFGLTYSLTDEAFIQNSSISNILTRFQLRANWGQSTNFPTPFSADREFAVNPFLGLPSFTFGNPGNPNLTSETINSLEVGADMSFIEGNIRFGITYYDNTTVDAIFTPPSTPSSGQLAQDVNLGEISNTGFEFALSADVFQTEEARLTLSGSLTTNENIVVDNGGLPEFVVGGFTFLGSFVNEGQPLGYFRGGNPIFDDEGFVTDVERNAFLGDPNPDGYGNLGLDFAWKGFSLFASADYQYGAQGVNVDDVLRFFGGINDEGRIPENAAGTSFFDLAGVWVEDADFFKVRNIGLSYNFDTANIPALSRLQLGVNLRNPIVRSSASFDPEITGSGIAEQGGFAVGGFGFGTESAPKQVIFSLKIGL